MKTWYTYHIIDPETNKVFYVGKGHGQRVYVHMTRALKWRQTGKIISGGNKHLYRKLLKIHDKELRPIYSIVFFSTIEKETLEREESDIRAFGLENLCNFTYGGEGEARSPETREKMSKAMRAFWDSEDGYTMRKQFSENRSGNGNPMWNKQESEEHKTTRMVTMLSQPRWNVGLKGDPRSKGHHIGEPAHNALKCRLVNEDGRIIEANSLREVSDLSGVPLVSVNRMRAGKKNKSGWKLE